MLSKKLISLIEKNISIIDDSREIPSEIIDELLNKNFLDFSYLKLMGE